MRNILVEYLGKVSTTLSAFTWEGQLEVVEVTYFSRDCYMHRYKFTYWAVDLIYRESLLRRKDVEQG